MVKNDLQKLKRAELLQILYEQSRRIDELEEALAEANKKLEDRRLIIENAGSLAEAVVKINQVMEAAQAAAEQYIYNIRQDGGKE
ncbi:MAG: DNA repair protein [Clostridia bacterium]|nr:DNA repair protein [Clostridia bacterium]